MSVSSDLKEMECQRKRSIAIRAALAAGEVKEQGIEQGIETQGNSTEASPLDLPPYNAATSPARLVDASPPGKPWMRGNVQWRPMTTREREAVENERFDKQMLKQWSDHGLKMQRAYDEKLLLDKQTATRIAKETRTGLRHLPHARGAAEDYISIEEAIARGFINNYSGEGNNQ